MKFNDYGQLTRLLILVPAPHLDKFLFLRAADNLKGILIDDLQTDGRNEIIDMELGDLYVMRYNPIRNYVNSGQIELI
jgi:hypothetical protein